MQGGCESTSNVVMVNAAVPRIKFSRIKLDQAGNEVSACVQLMHEQLRPTNRPGSSDQKAYKHDNEQEGVLIPCRLFNINLKPRNGNKVAYYQDNARLQRSTKAPSLLSPSPALLLSLNAVMVPLCTQFTK
jgi:hypothetical protein